MQAPGFAYVADALFERHEPPGQHPERPQRLAAVRAALEGAGVGGQGIGLPVRPASEAEILRVHTSEYLAQLAGTAGRGGWFDGDTYFSPGSWEAALAAAGGAMDVTRAVVSGDAKRGFAAVRPPGHHAEADRAMGFCLLNNVAVATAGARADGLERVAIVDWDVHHGNGTQHIFERDGSVLYVSVHQWPMYPGTGAASETGAGAGTGATINVPLPGGCGDADYAAAFQRVVVPALRRFRPELILVSAGFDAHASDPLAGMQVTDDGFAAMAEELADVADQVCAGRLALVLEGGYHLEALGRGIGRVLEVIAPGAPRAGWRAANAGATPGSSAAIESTLTSLGRAGIELEAP